MDSTLGLSPKKVLKGILPFVGCKVMADYVKAGRDFWSKGPGMGTHHTPKPELTGKS